jgi:hypothetical protein
MPRLRFTVSALSTVLSSVIGTEKLVVSEPSRKLA